MALKSGGEAGSAAKLHIVKAPTDGEITHTIAHGLARVSGVRKIVGTGCWAIWHLKEDRENGFCPTPHSRWDPFDLALKT